MKQPWFFLYLILTILFYGCESQPIPSNTKNVIEGITTRGFNTTSSLPAGSQALFHSTGEINIENPVFTFDGNSWKGNQEIQWSESLQSVTLTALYPAYNNEQFITENPYSNGELEDILIAKSSISSSDVQLSFKHLFSTLTLHLLSPLKKSITYISLATPKLEKLNADGSFSLSGSHTITPDINDSTGDYTFIIPPQENCSLTLTLIINGETISYQLSHTFVSGYKYECNVNDRETPGIKNAEELIAFSQLINNPNTYDGKWTLDNFGEMQTDGRILYKLLADIDLKGESINPIHQDSNNPFNHIFNGEGYTISNCKINAAGGVAGLFGFIGSSGIVKNLYLKDCSMSIPESASAGSGVGSIAGLCTGIISNCGVINANITNNKNSYTGGIVGTLRDGDIINSFIKNSKIKTTNASLGGLVGKTETGNIINCYSASNTITRNTNYCGGFCGFAENGKIINCYVYDLTFKNNTNTGQFIGRGIASNVTECYTDTGTGTYYLINKKEGNCTTTSNSLYNSDFTNSNGSVYNQLNQWITNNQSSYNYTFTPWTEDQTGTLPAIFTP